MDLPDGSCLVKILSISSVPFGQKPFVRPTFVQPTLDDRHPKNL
jgi:hypothetical protein